MISYSDPSGESALFLPDSRIAGTYSCAAGNLSQSVTVVLRSTDIKIV